MTLSNITVVGVAQDELTPEEILAQQVSDYFSENPMDIYVNITYTDDEGNSNSWKIYNQAYVPYLDAVHKAYSVIKNRFSPRTVLLGVKINSQ